MGNVKIGISINNRDYCSDLIRRLSEITTGVEFLTDGDFSGAAFVITEEIAREHFPVSLLTEKIALEIGEPFAVCLRRRTGRTMRTYVVRSAFGGCGCTSVSLTIARILAGRSGNEVALVCSSEKDIDVYCEAACERRSCRELDYMSGHGMSVDVLKYGVRDRYGVTVFTAGKQNLKLMEYLKQAGFGALVYDCGSSAESRKLTGQAVINIEGWGDSRSGDFEQRAGREIAEGSGEFYLLNKAPYRMAEGQFAKIPSDGESFVCRDGKVEIAMDRAFAASIRELVTIIEKELDDGQSDFYK